MTSEASSTGACAARAALAAAASALPPVAVTMTTGDVTNRAPANSADSTSGSAPARTETADDGARVTAVSDRWVALKRAGAGDEEHAAAMPKTTAPLTEAARPRLKLIT